MNRARHWAALLLAAGFALALASGLAACSGSDGDPPPTEAPPTPTATPEPSAVPVEATAPDSSTPTATATPTSPAETTQTPTATPEPPTVPAEPAVLEASTPSDEPMSTATAASEPTAAPVEPPTGDPSAATDEAEALPLLYDTYDLSGAVAEPGHYAFLADPADPGSAVHTYEELRDGSATALLVHTHDAHSVSHADLYDAVAPGDLVEWRQADDCFVRYQVTEVKSDPTGPAQRKLFAVAWMTYAFTGCSGAIPAGTGAGLGLGDLPNLGGASLTVPIRHALWQIVPQGMTSVMEQPVSLPHPFLEPSRTEDLATARQLPRWRDPALPSGWIFLEARVDPSRTPFGYQAFFGSPGGVGIGLSIRGEYAADRGYFQWASWRTTDDQLGVTETRLIAGRPAMVRYGGPNPGQYFPTSVRIYDAATESEYMLFGKARSLRGPNVEALIAIARSLFAHPPTLLLYDTYDPSGAVAEPGHYTFLADPADPTSAVHTYEELRDGSATALLVHTHDAHGISQAARYDAVEPGDLFEWRQADDCFVRYTVTEVPAPAAGAATRMFGVAWMTYAFTGCSGPIAADTAATLDWGELPDLGGTSLTAPVIHGYTFQIVPAGWTGEVIWTTILSAPATSWEEGAVSTTSIATARTLPYWRDLPGWTLKRATSGMTSDPVYGYCAVLEKEEDVVEICGGHAGGRYGAPPAVTLYGRVRETRVIHGYPVLVNYMPAGTEFSSRINPIDVSIYEPANAAFYLITGHSYTLSGTNVDALLDVARVFLAAETP